MSKSTFYLFTCPSGHITNVDEEQAEGLAYIICDQCDFYGFVEEGRLNNKEEEQYTLEDILDLEEIK